MSKTICRASSLCTPPNAMELIEMNDLERFRATLADESFDPNAVYEASHFASLLQIACKRKCKGDFVRALLEAGADPREHAAAIQECRTALHFAARERNAAAMRELLFAEDRKGDTADVNAVDSKGFTALHEVCNHRTPDEVAECLEVLLSRLDIRVNMVSRNGKTAIYLAASNGQEEAVRRLLKRDALVDVDKMYNETTARDIILQKFPGVFDSELKNMPVAEKDYQLMDYLYSGDENSLVKALDSLKESSKNISLDVDDGTYTLLQKASMDGLTEAAEALLKNNANPNKTSKRHATLPSQLAAQFGHSQVLKLLLDNNAGVTSPDGKTALHYVILEADPQSPRFKSYKECFDLLLEKRKDAINSADDIGNTPLHLAAKYGSEDFVLALMRNGAYIGTKNKFGIPPIANILESTLKKFLDSCVSCKRTPRDTNYRVLFNVNFLKPPTEHSAREDSNSKIIEMSEPEDSTIVTNECECDPLLYISKLKDTKHILTHPVFTSFLDIKWRGIRQLFWINLIIYLVFVCLLTIYILFFFEHQASDLNGLIGDDKPSELLESRRNVMNGTDREITAKALHVSGVGGIIWFLTTVLFVIIALRELFQLVVAPKHYICSLENYLEFGILIGCGLVLFYQSADFQIRPHISAVTILLSWAELVLLIGKHPRLSTNIEMLKTVSFNFLEFLAWYSLLIIAFALSFFSLFRNSTEEDNFFLNPGSSFFKTVVMVTGEFEAGELPFVMFPGTSHIIFVLFVFLVAIVLFNLLNGLAVSDTQAIREDAELVGIISRIKLIAYSEKILLSHPFWCKTCQNKDSCLFQAFTGLQRLSLSGITAQVQKVKLFPYVLPEGVISVLPNQDREIEFHPANTPSDYTGPCYSPMCRYYIDSSVLKAAEIILQSQKGTSIDCSTECKHTEKIKHLEETIQNLESKLDELTESSFKNQETLQKILQLVQNSYNSQISQ